MSGFSSGCGSRTSTPSATRAPSVGARQPAPSPASPATARDHSWWNQFRPLGEVMANRPPPVSMSIGRTTSYQARALMNAASSRMTRSAVWPRALSGSSSERNTTRPPVGKITVMRPRLNSATDPAARRISSQPTRTWS